MQHSSWFVAFLGANLLPAGDYFLDLMRSGSLGLPRACPTRKYLKIRISWNHPRLVGGGMR